MALPPEVVDDLRDYRNKVQDYLNGNMDDFRFKPYRVSRGVYEQRQSGTFMVRTRITAGEITLQQLKAIAQLADKYGHGFIHFTTRQDIQFHKVSLEDTVHVIEGLLEAGIMTKGTGGNTPRNVVCSPLSGVEIGEVFDVTPYARATAEFLLKDPTAMNLPRKFKIGFSNSPADTANATISDLGFIARINGGQKGFEVYGAGGLGNAPASAILLEEFIPTSDVLYHVQAMKELFETEGDRTNKHKARLRHVLHRIGEEEFRKRYKQRVAALKQRRNLDLADLDEPARSYDAGNEAKSTGGFLVKQKQPGYYSVYVHPENGNLPTGQLREMIGFLEALEYEVTIRISNTQGFFVRDLKGRDADEFSKRISDFTSPFAIDNSVACAGAATCKLGLCLSQNLLTAIRNRFQTADEDIKSQLPRIFVSGCPNSCGQHQKGQIGLSGMARRTPDGLVPMYAVYLAGKVGADRAALAANYGSIPTKKVPEFLYALAKLKRETGIAEFNAFVEEREEAIRQLVEQFGAIETFAQNPDLYYDFGSGERFSLQGRGPGECGAGVLDVIRLDIANAESFLQDFVRGKESQGDKRSQLLYDASLSAARALLVLKGTDSNRDREIFRSFIEHFVRTGFVRPSVETLIDHLIDFKLGDLDTLEPEYPEVAYLVAKVKAMYESLSPQLEITLGKEVVSQSSAGETEDTGWNGKSEDGSTPPGTPGTDCRTVDLRGVKCPLNFVKAKVAIAPLRSGDIIAFYLDHGEPIQNVPRSLESEGHRICSIEDYDAGYSKLVVQKG